MNVEQARFNMIEQQIRPWDVLDPEVLQLLSLVRREDFVPASLRHLAFSDTELPLKPGRSLLQPKVEARLLQELQLQPTDRVLELGTGSGYLTALMAHQAEQVISLEPDAELAEAAQGRLRRLGLNRAQVQVAPLTAGAAAQGPFDAIVLTGSVAEVPAALLAQLKPGGRLLAIVGQEPVMQAVLLRAVGAGQPARTELFDTVVARLPGATEPSAFAF
ncbi:protein-L-isoaspartate O-methyltransferase family protein [Inhella crocodyli]|jgi:protein-L-isoaspartate(D-aspartate) O-methyltransferase|uniref:Protein-L-isoaspartate O-methyltransferase n=1 Tax=Inhella crocodyli TaxID=2499851 RepID=A0A3S3TC21_9BURK|nr:protein-L-isoaspartate O-methyltransferase [Inhella crocodyli]RVT87712.1 protein-L-isoaspartate O-methyltransferase [Inhella crocodyli]